jgi:3-methyladenine DNA glycosylase/8-oxoguanine DNA glycosylase
MTDVRSECGEASGAARVAPAARIPVPPDFDFSWAVRFLAARAVPALEAVSPAEYRRVVRLDTVPSSAGPPAPVALAVRYVAPRAGHGARLEAVAAPRLPAAVLRRAVTRMFDLDADLAAFGAVAARDPLLGPVVAANPPGVRLPQLLDPFEALVRAILGQQVSVAAASTMTDRVVRLLGEPAPRLSLGGAAEPDHRAFPHPAAVAAAGAAALRALGITRAKSAALAGVALAIADGVVVWDRLRAAPAAEAERALVALPGVGPWTASYVRLRALGDRDAFPAADLGVLKALAARGVPRAGVMAAAERWRPWRGYATLHLWQSLEPAAQPPRADRPSAATFRSATRARPPDSQVLPVSDGALHLGKAERRVRPV